MPRAKSDDAEAYACRAIWSDEDEAFIALCAEFPSLSWLATSPETALQGLRRLITESIELLNQARKPIPIPISNRAFSGRLTINLSPDDHAQLAREAAETGITLTRLIRARLHNP